MNNAVNVVVTRGVRGGLRALFKLPSGLPLPLTVLRAAMEQGSLFLPARRDVAVRQVTLNGVQGEYLDVGATKQVILHIHGGAFFAGSARTHRAMACEFAARANVGVYVMNYRLAPEHAYPAGLEDVLATYRALLAMGYRPQDIVLGGDSGGCTLILALAMMLRDQGESLPAGLFMISPFLDLTLSRASVTERRQQDPMLTRQALARGAAAYCGVLPASDPRISPLFADLSGLPPVLVQAGEDEILLDDARDFATMARAAGVQVECETYVGMWHNFQMFNRLIPEGNRALDSIARFVRGRFGR